MCGQASLRYRGCASASGLGESSDMQAKVAIGIYGAADRHQDDTARCRSHNSTMPPHSSSGQVAVGAGIHRCDTYSLVIAASLQGSPTLDATTAHRCNDRLSRDATPGASSTYVVATMPDPDRVIQIIRQTGVDVRTSTRKRPGAGHPTSHRWPACENSLPVPAIFVTLTTQAMSCP